MNQLKNKDINSIKKEIIKDLQGDPNFNQFEKFSKISTKVCQDIIAECKENDLKENLFKVKCTSLGSELVRYVSQYVLAAKRNRPEKRLDALRIQPRSDCIRLKDFGFDCVEYGDDDKIRRGRSGRIEEKCEIESLNDEQKENLKLQLLINNIILVKSAKDNQLLIAFEDYQQLFVQLQELFPSLFFDGNAKKIILPDKYYDKLVNKLRSYLITIQSSNSLAENKVQPTSDKNNTEASSPSPSPLNQNQKVNNNNAQAGDQIACNDDRQPPSQVPQKKLSQSIFQQNPQYKQVPSGQTFSQNNSIESVYLQKIKQLILTLAIFVENNWLQYVMKQNNIEKEERKRRKKTSEADPTTISIQSPNLSSANTKQESSQSNKNNITDFQANSSATASAAIRKASEDKQYYQSYNTKSLRERGGFDFGYKVSKLWEDTIEFECDSEVTDSEEEEDDLFYYGYPHHPNHKNRHMNIDLLNPNSGQDSIIKQIFAQYDMQQYQMPTMMMMPPQTTSRRRMSVDIQDARSSNQNPFGFAQFFNPFAAAQHHYNLHYTPSSHQYYQMSPQPLAHHQHPTPPHLNHQQHPLMNNFAQLPKQPPQQLQNPTIGQLQSQNNVAQQSNIVQNQQILHLQNQPLVPTQIQQKQQQQQQLNQQSQNLYGLGQQTQSQQQHSVQQNQNVLGPQFNPYNLAAHNLHNLNYVQNMPLNLHNNPHTHGQLFLNAPPPHMFQMINNNTSQDFYNHLFQTQNFSNQFFPINLQPSNFNGNNQSNIPANQINNIQQKTLDGQANDILQNLPKQQQIGQNKQQQQQGNNFPQVNQNIMNNQPLQSTSQQNRNQQNNNDQQPSIFQQNFLSTIPPQQTASPQIGIDTGKMDNMPQLLNNNNNNINFNKSNNNNNIQIQNPVLQQQQQQQQRSLSHPQQAAGAFNILPSPESINSSNVSYNAPNQQQQQQQQYQQFIDQNSLPNFMPSPNMIQNLSQQQQQVNQQQQQQQIQNQQQQQSQQQNQQQQNIHNSNKKQQNNQQNQGFNSINQNMNVNQSSPSHNFGANQNISNNNQQNQMQQQQQHSQQQQQQKNKNSNIQMVGSTQHLQQYSNYKQNKNNQQNKDITHLVSPVQKSQIHKQYQQNNNNNNNNNNNIPPQCHSPLSAISLDDQLVGPSAVNNNTINASNSNNSINASNNNNSNQHFMNNYNNHPYGFNQSNNNTNNMNNNYNNYQNNLRGVNQKQQGQSAGSTYSTSSSNTSNSSTQHQPQNNSSRGQANSLGVLPGNNGNFNNQIQQQQQFNQGRQNMIANNNQQQQQTNKQNFQNNNIVNNNNNTIMNSNQNNQGSNQKQNMNQQQQQQQGNNNNMNQMSSNSNLIVNNLNFNNLINNNQQNKKYNNNNNDMASHMQNTGSIGGNQHQQQQQYGNNNSNNSNKTNKKKLGQSTSQQNIKNMSNILNHNSANNNMNQGGNNNNSNNNNQQTQNLPIISNIIQNINICSSPYQQQQQVNANNTSFSSNNSNCSNNNFNTGNSKNLKDSKRNNNFIRKPGNPQNNQNQNINHNSNNNNTHNQNPQNNQHNNNNNNNLNISSS